MYRTIAGAADEMIHVRNLTLASLNPSVPSGLSDVDNESRRTISKNSGNLFLKALKNLSVPDSPCTEPTVAICDRALILTKECRDYVLIYLESLSVRKIDKREI